MNIRILLRKKSETSASQIRLFAYAKEFAKHGHDVTIYFLISTDKSKINTNIHGVKIVYLWENDSYLEAKYKLVSYIMNLLKFRKKIIKGDIVMMYGDQVPFMLTLLSLKCKASIFCEITEHPYCEDRSLKSICNAYIANKCLKYFNGLFVISNSLRNYFVNNGIDSKKIEIINMFVDINRFSVERLNTANKYIAYCGKISVRKDAVDVLLNAFSIFYKKHPEYKLKIIGDFQNKEVKETLCKLVCKLNIEEVVEFTGKISPDMMPQILTDASILALARPDNIQSQNGFPTKLGEYLATGNPVAVTKVGDIPLYLKDKVSAFLSQPDDFQDFAKTLDAIVNDYPKAIEVGKEGKRLCFSDFSSEVQALKALSFMSKSVQ